MACKKCLEKRKKFGLMDAVKAKVTGTMNSAPLDLQRERMSICIKCPSLFKVTKSCLKCGCFVTQKVKFVESECPLKKW